MFDGESAHGELTEQFDDAGMLDWAREDGSWCFAGEAEEARLFASVAPLVKITSSVRRQQHRRRGAGILERLGRARRPAAWLLAGIARASA